MLRKLTPVLLALFLTAWASFVAVPIALAQSNIIGGGVFGDVKTGGAAYVGPGDIFNTSSIAAYSCSEAYLASYASGLGAACDVVDTSTGLITCTYHFQANGKVNPSECNGVGQSCQTACSIAKAYDQTGNGRHATQVTLAQMPTLTFNSTPLGTLPAINCGTGASTIFLATSATVTQAQPLTLYAVGIRNGNFTTAMGMIGSAINNGDLIGPFSAINTWEMYAGTAVQGTAADNAWHAASGLANGASGAINIDGSDTIGNSSALGLTAELVRLCRAGTLAVAGLIAEAAFWGVSTTSTNRNAISANAHSAGRYNF